MTANNRGMAFVWLAVGVLAYHLALAAVLAPLIMAWRDERRERAEYPGCWACRRHNPYAAFPWAPRAAAVTMAVVFTAGVVITLSAPFPYLTAGIGASALVLFTAHRATAIQELVKRGRGVPYSYHDRTCPHGHGTAEPRPVREEPDNMGGVGNGM